MAKALQKNISFYFDRAFGAFVGSILYPLITPFLQIADIVRRMEESNRKIWQDNKNKEGKVPGQYIALAILHIIGNTLGHILALPFLFVASFFYAFYQGIRDGIKHGIKYVLSYPSEYVNAYSTNKHDSNGLSYGKNLGKEYEVLGKKIFIPVGYYLRSQHLIILAAIAGLLFAIVATALTLTGIFSPLGFIAAKFRFNAFALLGLTNLGPVAFAMSTFVLNGILASIVSAVISTTTFIGTRLLHGIRVIADNIRSPKKLARGFSQFVDRIVATALAIPIYTLSKPLYQLAHSARKLHRSNKVIWHSINELAEKSKYHGNVWNTIAYNLLAVILMSFNSIGRCVLMPFECIISLVYAPYQAVRHASKHGTDYVLNYPYQYANNYKTDGSEYVNVYYFRLKHIIILSIILAVIIASVFTVTTAVGAFAPLVWLSTHTSLNVLAFLGISHASVATISAATFFISGIAAAAATHIIAATMYALSYLASWLGGFTSILKRLINGKHTLNNVFHKVVHPGEPFRLLRREQALVKILSSQDNDETEDGRSWEYLYKQLREPHKVRLVRDYPSHISDPSRVWNPLTAEISTKKRFMGTPEPGKRNDGRDRTKWWKWYTKKTSASLPPKDGQMHFFPLSCPVGTLWDINKCDLKGGKYVFPMNVVTNGLWWIDPTSSTLNNPNMRATTIQQLRNNNNSDRSKGIIPNWNEILAGLSKYGLLAIFSPNDTFTDRVNALYRKLIVKLELGIDVPIAIMTETAPVRYYPVEQQLVDLYVVLYRPNSSTYSSWSTAGGESFAATSSSIFSMNTGYNSDPAKNMIQKIVKKLEKGNQQTFIRALIDSHHIDWQDVFTRVSQNSYINFNEFKFFIHSNSDVNLDADYTHETSTPNHFSPCVA